MAILGNSTISRRSAIAGALASIAVWQSGASIAQQIEQPASVELGHGLEIRDYRLFPTEDVTRFIVEIHNTTDSAIDTPGVGVILPHLDEMENFGWANPVGSVLHPNSSEMLIGVAPLAMTSNDDWGEPKWMLCDNIQSTQSESIAEWDIDFTHRLEILTPTHAQAHFDITNIGNSRARTGYILGLVRDKDGRICGSTLPSSVQSVLPGASEQQLVNITPAATYISNPFVLIDTTEGLDASFSLQPRSSPINRGCSPVLPWNQ